jgi:hypothetical protein
MIVEEISGAILPQKMRDVIERRLVLRAMSKEEFDSSLTNK